MEELRHSLSCFHWYLTQLEISCVRTSARGGSGKGWDTGDGQAALSWLQPELLRCHPWGYLSLMLQKPRCHGRAGLRGDIFLGQGCFGGMPVCGAPVWLQPLHPSECWVFGYGRPLLLVWGFLQLKLQFPHSSYLTAHFVSLFPEYPWCRLSCNKKPLPNLHRACTLQKDGQ